MAGAIIIGIPVLRKPSTILVNVYSTSYGRGPYVDTQTRVENGLNINTSEQPTLRIGFLALYMRINMAKTILT